MASGAVNWRFNGLPIHLQVDLVSLKVKLGVTCHGVSGGRIGDRSAGRVVRGAWFGLNVPRPVACGSACVATGVRKCAVLRVGRADWAEIGSFMLGHKEEIHR
jgi:hypothetical protein